MTTPTRQRMSELRKEAAKARQQREYEQVAHTIIADLVILAALSVLPGQAVPAFLPGSHPGFLACWAVLIAACWTIRAARHRQ